MLSPLRANASVHFWQIKEVYSNSTGSIQYIELFSTQPGQTLLNTHTLVVNDGSDHTLTFTADLTVDTMNKHLLIATPGFKNVAGAPTPDITLPCGPFFNPSAATITITFAETVDTLSFAGSTLPKDGTNSLTDGNLGGTANLTSGTNSPTNLASSMGPITPTTNQANGTQDICNDLKFCNGTEGACSAGACGAGTAPCAQQCIEGSPGSNTGTCVECINAGHCDDGNPCTDDTCDGSNVCQHAAHVGSCTDNMFCNGADTCSGTTCVHAGDPCGGANCNEGPDTCGDCQGAADCEDGQPCTVDTCTTGQCNRATAADGAQCDDDTTFCNGVGSCTTGVCGAIAAPCYAMTETCDGSHDASQLTHPATPDAPGPTNPKDDDDGGGCCQANTSPATFTGPGLVLLLGLAFGRRRRPFRVSSSN